MNKFKIFDDGIIRGPSFITYTNLPKKHYRIIEDMLNAAFERGRNSLKEDLLNLLEIENDE